MLKKALLGIVLNGLALYGVTYVLQSVTYSGGWIFFVIGGVVIGALNYGVKPLLKILTFPLHILTLGLSLIVLNGVIFWLFSFVIDTLAIEGVTLTVPGIKMYFFAGILFGIVNWILHLAIHNK